MKDTGLPKFGSPEDFVDLHDIVKQHAEQDSTWTAKIEKVANRVPGQVQQFMEHPIKARNNITIVKCEDIQVSGMGSRSKGGPFGPMDQHRFLYANTCDELFVKWSEYEKSHQLQ
jgi:hypothetical protein